MNIRQKLSLSLISASLLALAATAHAGVIVGPPPVPYYSYGYYPPPVAYGGYVPPGAAYGYPMNGAPNPALQNSRMQNPVGPSTYMNGAPIPRGSVAPDPRFYDGGNDYYLY